MCTSTCYKNQPCVIGLFAAVGKNMRLYYISPLLYSYLPKEIKRGNQVSTATILAVTYGGSVIVPPDCLSTNSKGFCYPAFTMWWYNPMHDTNSHKKGNAYRKKLFARPRNEKKMQTYNNSLACVMAKWCEGQILPFNLLVLTKSCNPIHAFLIWLIYI